MVLTVYHLLEGEVLLRKGAGEALARRGDWIVCHPGERYQQFSDSARLLSLHFQLDCPTAAAKWTGNPVVIFQDNSKLEHSLRRLRNTTVLKKLSTQGRLNPEGESASLDAVLELKEHVTAFFRLLVGLLKSSGMQYEASSIHDARVRESRRQLAISDFFQGFSRQNLAKSVGVGPSQLDRLWIKELGETPRHYWNWRRLEMACRLLLETKLVKEVAYETGFKHLSQFSLWFHANMNESPQEFQRRHR